MKINMQAFTEGFEKRGSEKVALLGTAVRAAGSIGGKILRNPVKSSVAGLSAMDVAGRARTASTRASTNKLVSLGPKIQ